MTTTYCWTVEIKRRTLLDRLLRRDARQTTNRPPCPECGAEVESLEPHIRQGREWTDGYATYRENDEVVDHELKPCGHRVDRAAFCLVGYESTLVRELTSDGGWGTLVMP